MPSLMKQPVDISFAKGVDTKTDKWRVGIGSFLSLVNMVFTTGMRLTKRNGYGELSSLPELASYLTTFNGNLTAIGTNLQAYVAGTRTWENKGTLHPVKLETLPLIRSNTNQSQLDTAISANNLVCTVYTDQTPTSLSTPRYMFAVADAITGQNIIEPTPIPVTSGAVTGSPRVFLLGSYFVIVFTNVISGTSHLQYIAVSTSNPNLVTANTDIASSYIPATTLSWDGVVAGQNLYIGYNTTAGGQAIKIAYLTSTLILATAQTYSNSGKVTATMMSLYADQTGSSPVIWCSYYDANSENGYAFAVDSNLNKLISTPVEIITSETVLNLTSVASGGNPNGELTFYYEVSNAYSYDSDIPTNFINANTLTLSGTLGSEITLVRSVGLASKAFIADGEAYFLAAYQSTFQSTYFLINAFGEVVSRLAYSNGGGYDTVGLPSVMVNGNLVQFGYLFKDFVTSQNTSSVLSVTKSNIYSQTGLNLASLTLGTSNVVPAEIAQALHLSGGFLWEYDGYLPVEHNFFLWPDDVEGEPANTGGSLLPQEYQYQVVYTWTDNQGNVQYSAPSIPLIVDMSTNNPSFSQPTALTPTGTFTSGENTIVVSSASGLAIGQIVTDTDTPDSIQVGSYITNISGTTITLSQNVTADSGMSGDALSITSVCSVTLDIPTLRLTYKIANPVKIEIFRWSTAQEEFFQVTSIQTPLINNVGVDSVEFVDTFADNQISGNSLIYTTGGVIEDIGAPSFNALTLFDDRLWGIDAEDPNLLWYSKQVLETTPVEMSDLLTLYIAPSIASQGSTGNMKCISPMDDKLIIFKANALYYINGTGPDNLGLNSQYSQPIFITSVVGSANQQSIVFTPPGLMFQSDKGIWILGRDLSVNYIGAPVEKYTTGAIVQSAVSIPGTTQVRFTLDTGITLMYDYFYQQWGTFSGVPAISSTLYQDLHTFLDSFGRVFQETPGEYLDGSNPVTFQFTTSWINLAGLQGYQRAYFFYLLGEYISPHYLNMSIAYDYNPSPIQNSLITPSNYSKPYGIPSPYGQGSPYGGPSSVEQWRVFLTKQRCQSFQLSLQEIYDPSLGVPAGAGLSISGLNLLIAVARSFRAISSAHSIGGSNSGGNQ